jgi:L-lactate utilization protein LutB
MVQKRSEKGKKKEDVIKVTIEAPMHIVEPALKMAHDIFGFMASVKKKK